MFTSNEIVTILKYFENLVYYSTSIDNLLDLVE